MIFRLPRPSTYSVSYKDPNTNLLSTAFLKISIGTFQVFVSLRSSLEKTVRYFYCRIVLSIKTDSAHCTNSLKMGIQLETRRPSLLFIPLVTDKIPFSFRFPSVQSTPFLRFVLVYRIHIWKPISSFNDLKWSHLVWGLILVAVNRCCCRCCCLKIFLDFDHHDFCGHMILDSELQDTSILGRRLLRLKISQL